MEITIGHSLNPPSAASATFADNFDLAVLAFTRKRVLLPARSAGGSPSPDDLDLIVELDQAISTFPDFGSIVGGTPTSPGSLIVDVTVWANSDPNGVLFPLDGKLNGADATVFTQIPSGTFGGVLPQFAPTIRFLSDYERGITPTLDVNGSPDAGSTFGLVLDDAPASAPYLTVLGLDNRSISGSAVALPLDLATFDAPRCFLLASPDLSFPGGADANGGATTTLGIPAGSDLVGTPLYFQALVLDPRANILGLTTTNGVEIVVGGR